MERIKNKEQLLLYPYDYNSAPILRYAELLEDYEIVKAVSPFSWGISGNDGGTADMGPDIGLIVEDDFEKALDACDTVLFVKTDNPLVKDCSKMITEKLDVALQAGKNIICTLDLDKERQEQIENFCRDSGLSCRFYNEDREKYRDLEVDTESLYDFQTPVLFVLGLGERTSKFNIQLALRKEFLEKGYNVSQIGSRSCCDLFKFHSFPAFMFDKAFSEPEKIVLFNHFVKSIELEEKPDLIIIGIPGGIMPMNNMFTNNFGITAYEVSQAVTPDSAVISTLYEEYLPVFFTELAKQVEYKLGFTVDCFNVSNIQLYWNNSIQEMKLDYVSLDSTFVKEQVNSIEGLPVKAYSILNKHESAHMAELLIDNMAGYGYTEGS